jgi:hypothetical protein
MAFCCCTKNQSGSVLFFGVISFLTFVVVVYYFLGMKARGLHSPLEIRPILSPPAHLMHVPSDHEDDAGREVVPVPQAKQPLQAA